jgi:hypothetical protein
MASGAGLLARAPGTEPALHEGVPTSSVERRVHRRVRLERDVTVELENARFTGRSINVSVGGMALELACDPRAIAAGDRVTVRLDLGSGAFALTTGEVMRVTAREIGLRFVALDRTSLLALLSCVGSDTREKPARQSV